MTELERQLSEALQSLAAQYEREQKRQAESVEGLRKQLQRLAAQVAGVVSHINSWNRQVFGPDYPVTYWVGRRNSPGEVNALAPWYACRKP